MYTVGVVLMFPAMVMAMAAGAVFGMLYGTLLVWLGSSLGQTVAFVIGRCGGLPLVVALWGLCGYGSSLVGAHWLNML